ncbi:hypothetical protein B0H10DRAFT_1785229 [Mycena sp. CBHHK59/15]|nr:hypothetical protein B0H10DRAFT_1785229 [Mycena sp. CBHHK59/15]
MTPQFSIKNDDVEYGEVQFYFQADIKGKRGTFALVSVYSAPDMDLLEDSEKTIWSCSYRGLDALVVIPVKRILSVVGMVPLGDKFLLWKKWDSMSGLWEVLKILWMRTRLIRCVLSQRKYLIHTRRTTLLNTHNDSVTHVTIVTPVTLYRRRRLNASPSHSLVSLGLFLLCHYRSMDPASMFHSSSARFPTPNHNRRHSPEQGYRERSNRSGSYESDEETSRVRTVPQLLPHHTPHDLRTYPASNFVW